VGHKIADYCFVSLKLREERAVSGALRCLISIPLFLFLYVFKPRIISARVEIENFIDANKHLGYTTREELIREAIRFKLGALKGQCEYIEVPKEDYEKLQQAVLDLDTGFLSADDFIEKQIQSLLEKHEAWIKQKEDYKKRK